MPGITIGTSGPPRSSPAYNELDRRAGSGTGALRRWSGRACDLLPGGMLFWQMGAGDRGRYEQAGCSPLGAQASRQSLVVGGALVGQAVGTTFSEAWCCQPQQVVDVFEQWVASPEYQKNRMYGLCFAGALVLGVGYLLLNRKKLGLKMGGESTQRIGWSANPGANVVVERTPVYPEDTERSGWVESYDIFVDDVIVAAIVRFAPGRAVVPDLPWFVIPDYAGDPDPGDGFSTKREALEWVYENADAMLFAEENMIDRTNLKAEMAKADGGIRGLGAFEKLIIEARKHAHYKPTLVPVKLSKLELALGILREYDVMIQNVRVGLVSMHSLEAGETRPWRAHLTDAEQPDPDWEDYATRDEALLWFEENAEEIFEHTLASIRAKRAPTPVLSPQALEGMVYTEQHTDKWITVYSKNSNYILGSLITLTNSLTGSKKVRGSPAGPIGSKDFGTASEALNYVVTYAQPTITRAEGERNLASFAAVFGGPKRMGEILGESIGNTYDKLRASINDDDDNEEEE